MKLIFLDIDGVLNRHVFNFASQSCDIEPECVHQLNRVLLETGASIVVSSAWRYMVHGGAMTVAGFDYMLRTHGVIHGRVIGVTREDASEDEPRWMQISDWFRSRTSDEPIESYCILDDLPQAFGGRPGVQTAGGIGLTEADADAAIEILGRVKEPVA